jgi:hypothetical protein
VVLVVCVWLVLVLVVVLLLVVCVVAGGVRLGRAVVVGGADGVRGASGARITGFSIGCACWSGVRVWLRMSFLAVLTVFI